METGTLREREKGGGEQETDRQTETNRQTDRDTQRETDTETDRQSLWTSAVILLNRQVGGGERGANKNSVHVFERPRADSADEEKEK